MASKIDNIEVIEDLLKTKYQTSFSVSLDKFGYMVIANNRKELADVLEVDVNSDNFEYDLDKIEKAVNLVF